MSKVDKAKGRKARRTARHVFSQELGVTTQFVGQMLQYQTAVWVRRPRQRIFIRLQAELSAEEAIAATKVMISQQQPAFTWRSANPGNMTFLVGNTAGYTFTYTKLDQK